MNAWLAEQVRERAQQEGLLRLREGGPLLWLELTVLGAAELDDACFREAVARAYDRLGEELHERGQRPLRWWNYIPIRRASAEGFTRYELFNAGRHDSFRSWPDAPERGHGGDLLSVASGVREAFASVRRFELAEADLCRPELMVELEGMLELG